jgi:hypothetical protein
VKPFYSEIIVSKPNAKYKFTHQNTAFEQKSHFDTRKYAKNGGQLTTILAKQHDFI